MLLSVHVEVGRKETPLSCQAYRREDRHSGTPPGFQAVKYTEVVEMKTKMTRRLLVPECPREGTSSWEKNGWRDLWVYWRSNFRFNCDFQKREEGRGRGSGCCVVTRSHSRDFFLTLRAQRSSLTFLIGFAHTRITINFIFIVQEPRSIQDHGQYAASHPECAHAISVILHCILK